MTKVARFLPLGTLLWSGVYIYLAGDTCGGGGLAGLAWLFGGLLVVVVAALVVLVTIPPGPAHSSRLKGPLPSFLTTTVIAALTVTAAYRHWPLRIAFMLSRSSLDNLVVSTGDMRVPVRAGLFEVWRIERGPDLVRLLTEPACLGFDTGLAYANRKAPKSDEVDLYSTLGGSWWLWEHRQ
jgi:hypothetical protein